MFHTPNTLLACNDSRFPTYPSILKQSQEAQKKVEEEKKKAEEERLESLEKEYSSKFPEYAESVIEMCFSNTNSNTTFEVASPSCETELHNLNRDCQTANSTYNYCKDERFLGYLKKHGIQNSTASP